MLPPEYYDDLADNVVRLFQPVITDILEDMARRIVKMGEVTSTAKWQMERLEALGASQEYILQQMERLTGQTQGEIRGLFAQACVDTTEYDNRIYRAVGLTPQSLQESEFLRQIAATGLERTENTFFNLTQTTAQTATKQLENALDRAYLQLVTGAFDYKQVITWAVKDLARQNIGAITYPSGHVDSLDVVVRRAIITGVSQTAGELSLSNARAMGCDLMELTAHAGARPTHAVWQGQLVSLSGRIGYLSLSDIGYGTVTGFKGTNCRHDWHPYFEELSKEAYSRLKLQEYANKVVYFSGKKLSYYDATQKQRYLERQIRRWKREYLALRAGGLDTGEASARLAAWRQRQKDFLGQTGLHEDNFRSQVVGFGRSEAVKARAQARHVA